MKTMMDEVASEIVSKTEAKRKKGKKKTMQKRSSVGRASEIFTFEEDEIDVVEEDGNDSDWSPDQSPAKKKAKALNVQDEQEESAEKELTMRKESISSCYASKKVSELRVLLRERGLKVSGKKQELIARLVTSEKSLSEEEGTKEERKARTIEGSEDDKENRGVHVSDTGSKAGRERKALVVINTKDSQEKKESLNSEEDKEGKLPMLLSRSAKKRKRRSMVDAVNTAMQALSNLENTI